MTKIENSPKNNKNLINIITRYYIFNYINMVIRRLVKIIFTDFWLGT